MQKAEKQQVRNPYSPREPGGLSMDSPNGERVAQFQSMIDSSPVMASQRRKMERIEQRQEEGPLQTKPNETGLPDNLKSGIKSLSGMSMDSVRVHYNSSKPAQLNALAYAQGTDIHVAPGQEQHLPHEAWHVVQQAQGRVQPNMQMKANTDVGPNYMQSIQRKVLLNGEEYIPEKNENVSKEINEATEDEFVRYYENKKEVLDHIDNKEPGNYGLIKPRALWYRIPYLNKKFFVFGESHAAVKGSQIKTESHITKPILDEKLSGWQAEDMINNQLVDELDAGLDENSSKLLRALEMWSVHVRSKPTVGGTGAIDLPKISKGETSTREKENGTYRLVVYGEDGSEEYWKPSGSNEVPQNTYDPQTQMLDAIESLFSKVFSEEIKNSFDKFPNGVIVGKAWGHFKDKSWVGHEKETLIKQNVSRFLYDAAKFKVSSEYGKLGEIGDIKTKDEKWNADNYRDEFMFLRILKAKDGGFSFASIGNAHLVRLKDRFNEKNIPFISMEDFYGSYAVDAVDTKKIAHKNSPVFRKNQRMMLWLKSAFSIYPNLQQEHLDTLDNHDVGEFVLSGKVSKLESKDAISGKEDRHKPVLDQFLMDLKKAYPNCDEFIKDLSLEEIGEFLNTEKISRWDSL